VETYKINKKEDKYLEKTAVIIITRRKKEKRRENRVKSKRETEGFARKILSSFLISGL
jgi:hypothetical protein